MVVLLMSMVNSKQPLSLRLAVLYCTACWLHKNPIAQSELVDTLLPSDAPTQGGVTAGQLLCGALFSPDPTTSWLAATALSHSILNQKGWFQSEFLKTKNILGINFETNQRESRETS